MELDKKDHFMKGFTYSTLLWSFMQILIHINNSLSLVNLLYPFYWTIFILSLGCVILIKLIEKRA